MPARLSLTKAQRYALRVLPDTEEALVRHYPSFCTRGSGCMLRCRCQGSWSGRMWLQTGRAAKGKCVHLASSYYLIAILAPAMARDTGSQPSVWVAPSRAITSRPFD